MKIRPVGAELLHAGGRASGQTDMMKLLFAFRSFANAPKNRSATNLHLWLKSWFVLRVGPDKVTNSEVLALAGM